MSRVVYKSLAKIPDRAPPAGVSERTVQLNGDAPSVVHVLDGHRETFGTDLAYVFGRNVARTRKENEQLTGNPDGIVVRG